MPETIRFHLDEQISNAIAAGLRRRRIDVTTTPELGLKAASDEAQLAFAKSENRVIFTQDDDFLALLNVCMIDSPHPQPFSLGRRELELLSPLPSGEG